jgi:hypothetical protein
MPGTETDVMMLPLLSGKNDLRHKKTQKFEEDNNLLWTKSVFKKNNFYMLLAQPDILVRSADPM